MRIRALMAAAAALCALSPTAATAAAPSPTGTGVRWLALGDSISSGFGIDAESPRPAPWGENCRRADGDGIEGGPTPPPLAWPAVAARAIGASQTFTACSGAITDQWVQQVAEGYADSGASLTFPESDSLEEAEPQLREQINALAARGQTWDIVSFTFGINNLGLGPAVEDCLDTTRSGDPMTWDGTRWGDCSERLKTLRAQSRVLVGAERGTLAQGSTLFWNAADPGTSLLGETARFVRPGGTLLVLGYPQLYAAPEESALAPYVSGPEAASVNCDGLSPIDTTAVRDTIAYVNSQLKQATVEAQTALGSRVRILYVDPNEVVDSSPHGLCSEEPWINSPFVPGPLHPNAAGHAGIGALVVDKVRS